MPADTTLRNNIEQRFKAENVGPTGSSVGVQNAALIVTVEGQ